jgi:hypothetical protein
MRIDLAGRPARQGFVLAVESAVAVLGDPSTASAHHEDSIDIRFLRPLRATWLSTHLRVSVYHA